MDALQYNIVRPEHMIDNGADATWCKFDLVVVVSEIVTWSSILFSWMWVS